MKCDELKPLMCAHEPNIRPMYGKSEVDAAIAELKEKLQNVSELLNETREWLIESQKMHKRCADNAIKKIRHHKYRRCLAMAKWCHSMWILLRDENETKRSVFYWRWWNIWLEIADKFKEGV